MRLDPKTRVHLSNHPKRRQVPERKGRVSSPPLPGRVRDTLFDTEKGFPQIPMPLTIADGLRCKPEKGLASHVNEVDLLV